MDFNYHYSQAQEDFRAEVTAWLDANLPHHPKSGGSVFGPLSDLRRRLGEKGWLAPTEPAEFGGFGASQGEEVILAEELGSRGLGRLQDQGSAAVTRAIHGWASESPLLSLIPEINGGRVFLWQACIPPEVSPEPSQELRNPTGVIATEDGDDYVLNGHGWFAGPHPAPDYLWTLAQLDVEIPPGEATRDFTISLLVPAGLDGIYCQPTRQLVNGGPRQVGFDQVRVPRTRLLGSKGQGWDLMHSALNAGPETDAPPALDAGVIRLQEHAESTTKLGLPLIQDPVIQHMVMDVYIDGRVTRLFETRDAWMRANGQKTTYQPAQTRIWRKRAAQRYSKIVRQVVGVYALLDDKDPRSPAGGEFELQQRQSLESDDPAGVSGSDAAIIARHLGMARAGNSCAQAG